ncbi:trigger factor [bacterium]|nr:trigger factor [bacterium]
MIKVEIKEKSETTKILKVELPPEDVDAQFEKVTSKFRKKASLPGFRQGKVPWDVIAKTYSRQIYEEVLEHLFHNSYRQALDQTKLAPIQSPRLEKMELKKGEPLRYEITLEVLPKVKLPSYKRIKLKSSKNRISQDEIQGALENLRQHNAVLESVEGRVSQTGDVLLIDFIGCKNQQPLPGVKAEGYNLELGSGRAIAAFESNLIGMAVGETRTFEGDFPEDYHATELAGQTIEFTVTLKALQEKKMAELNDDFARDLGPFKDLPALQEQIKQDLEAEKERQNRDHLHGQVMQELGRAAQVKIPEVLIEQSLANMFEDRQSRPVREKQTGDTNDVVPEEFRKQNRPEVELLLKARLAVREIAICEKIDITGEEMEAEVGRMARASRQSVAAVKEYLVKKQHWNEIQERLRDNKVLDFIISNAVIKEI